MLDIAHQPNRLVETGLWCEEKDDQPCVRIQICSPKSGIGFLSLEVKILILLN